MFNIFQKTKPKSGETITLKISGMHCTACALNIDTELEELPGVISSTTNYAKSQTVVIFNPDISSPDSFAKIITSLGYETVAM